jgi:hypothetical protein
MTDNLQVKTKRYAPEHEAMKVLSPHRAESGPNRRAVRHAAHCLALAILPLWFRDFSMFCRTYAGAKNSRLSGRRHRPNGKLFPWAGALLNKSLSRACLDFF